MADPQPPQPPDLHPPYTLDYATPERPASGLAFLGQMVLGFIAFWAMGIVLLSLTINVSPVIGFGLMAVLQVAMIALAVQYPSWRGFVVGELTGLGLVLLALGICAGAFR